MKKRFLLALMVLSVALLIGCSTENPPPASSGGGETFEPYELVVPEVMPRIDITTPDGDNSWATKYTREDKLNGLIDYTDATVSVTNCDEEYVLNAEKAEVKVRGNYTLIYDKKPIRIKFKEKNGMLGMNGGQEYKNWVLLCEWKDPSLLRNALTFYLGNTILGQDGFYSSDFRTVEVYLNGSYWGVYLLSEQQEAKDGRTSVPEVPKNYAGTDIGYFFEYDGYYMLEGPDGDPTFEMAYGGGRADLRGYTVKSDINSPAQLDFLRSYLNNLYLIVERANKQGVYYKFDEDKKTILLDKKCQSAKDAVGAVIDLDSLVDTYILNELACDLDVDYSSFYLSLDMTAKGKQKLIFEAPWDFDSAYGIWIDICNDAEGLYAMERGNPWFKLFEGVEWFEELVKEKWAKLKEDGVFMNAAAMIERLSTQYAQHYVQNHERWEKRVTQGHGSLIPSMEVFPSVAGAHTIASQQLSDWFARRLAYLDSVWTKE